MSLLEDFFYQLVGHAEISPSYFFKDGFDRFNKYPK